MRKSLDLKHATRVINHGPVVLVASAYGGKTDITPVAWLMPVEKDPPIIALEIYSGHFIYKCIMKTGDFTVNVPSVRMARTVVDCGSVSGRDTDKVKRFSIKMERSKKVKSPSMKDALAVLECKLVSDKYLARKYNIILGRVKAAAACKEAFGEHWLLKKRSLATLHHLGDKTFCSPARGVIDMRKK